MLLVLAKIFEFSEFFCGEMNWDGIGRRERKERKEKRERIVRKERERREREGNRCGKGR